MPGVLVYDDPLKKLYPMPLDATGKDEVYVGRIREDASVTNGLNLWVVSDNPKGRRFECRSNCRVPGAG